MARKIRKPANKGGHNPEDSGAIQPTSRSRNLVSAPRVSPGHVTMVKVFATIGGFGLIAYDGWMSWQGFEFVPDIDMYGQVTLTSLVMVVQLASGVIQALGGNPFVGLGGNPQADGIVGNFIKAIYFADFLSNFAGWGGGYYLSPLVFLRAPFESLAMLALRGLLSILLVFGDEMVFRLRDRLIQGSRGNQQRARLFNIRKRAHDKALDVYERIAMRRAEELGRAMDVDFEWIEDDIDD